MFQFLQTKESKKEGTCKEKKCKSGAELQNAVKTPCPDNHLPSVDPQLPSAAPPKTVLPQTPLSPRFELEKKRKSKICKERCNDNKCKKKQEVQPDENNNYEESSIEDQCKLCKKTDTENKVEVWLGCSTSNCTYWCHVKCMGFVGCTEATFDKVDWYCSQHKPIYFAKPL
jgi:hypothetical protein